MKAIIIVDIDEDRLYESGKDRIVANLEDGSFQVVNLEEAIGTEMGWVEQSGIFVEGVILEDSIKPNDADLGDQIRKQLID